MPRTLKHWMVAILAFYFMWIPLIGSLSPALSETTESPISVVMDNNYPPYIFKDVEGELKGILMDEWALWSKRTGIPVTISAMD